jgi:L-ascorbate metabolism protein UlaG (beta-lactamase superfamily)
MSLLQGVHWLGHASFRIEAEGQVIYIDPWKLELTKEADLILVTHGHRDHLSPEDLTQIAGPETVIVCAAPYVEQIEGDVRGIAAGETMTVGPVTIEAVPSYNIDKPNHPKCAGNVGYILEIGGRGIAARIYHAGDTDLIPEMDDIDCDVALLPMGGTYTMNAEQAAEAVARIKPQIVVPMHWGGIVGTREDVEHFQRLVEERTEGAVQVVVMQVEA